MGQIPRSIERIFLVVLKCTILQFYVSNDTNIHQQWCRWFLHVASWPHHLIDVHMVQV